MSKVTVCARFRPLSSSEIRDHGSCVSIHRIDNESFNFKVKCSFSEEKLNEDADRKSHFYFHLISLIFFFFAEIGCVCFLLKDEKDGDLCFSFDKAFYEDSAQASVYEALALPIVQDAVNAINGTILTYGQGAGILKCDAERKGLIPRVIEGLFEMINSSHGATAYSVKLSMVEIYMEKVRDLFDMSKDNIQIKESKSQGIILSGVTEIPVLEAAEAMQILSNGIANRAVGETQMNVSSSRSHCVYTFTVQQETPVDKRTKTGKLMLVDLAGSEKVGKTGAEGRLLDEAKTINKSLSALGNVVNALTCSPQNKLTHIPYRDSKLTRILQDALGGSCRMALLCCCSPSPSNASETLSTLRFGARAQHIKAAPSVILSEDKISRTQESTIQKKDLECERILDKLKDRIGTEEVELLEELLILEGIMFYPAPTEDLKLDYDNVTSKIISSLQKALKELASTADELKKQNKVLETKLAAAENRSFWDKMSDVFSLLSLWC
ncbi:kinesin-like protein KIN-1 isoform X4 [Beta vulgaris subsp. vulgaris]|uniref:kinesin-like protein KIN-1 isoform X4 n=1 Tax=Beta vulgaris subsp. vulgaris TaxID=3555 RepID=UPI002036D467|nr:kinesin-like protein KIN-1 isoform X4 [Beta vulgaris subsp. vulgaris]